MQPEPLGVIPRLIDSRDEARQDMGESKYITYEEYEDCYREALLLLKERFNDVGQPYQVDGQRVCSIKTGLFDQPLLFKLDILTCYQQCRRRIVGRICSR
jgi:hypothetical protein